MLLRAALAFLMLPAVAAGLVPWALSRLPLAPGIHLVVSGEVSRVSPNRLLSSRFAVGQRRLAHHD
jgi:hypothetical protein